VLSGAAVRRRMFAKAIRSIQILMEL